MAFTLHVGVSIMGKKDNIELTFPTKPNLPELVHRVQAVFTQETNVPFNIDQIRIYDEVLGRWVDLVREDQLHGFAQLYAFQPDTPQNCDSRGLLPAPRPVGGAFPASPQHPPPQGGGYHAPSPGYGNPAPLPHGGDVIDPRQAEIDAQKEAERHRLIAQHLSGQLGSPHNKMHSNPPPPQGMMGQSPLTPRQGGGAVVGEYLTMNSPSQHSPIQVSAGGPGFAAPLPGVNPQQAEIDAQKEAERHRLIAQHLSSQLGAGTPTHGYAHPSGINHHPAPSPVNPSPVQYMGSPATPGQGGFHHAPPPQFPASPMLGGYGPGTPGGANQAEIDAQKEAERHRLIAQHLSSQLGQGQGQSHGTGQTPYNTPTHPAAATHHPSPAAAPVPLPFSPDQHIHQQWANSPSQVPYQHPQSPMYAHPTPAASPAHFAPPQDEALKEAERHRLISQHLNQQLQSR